MYLNCIDTYMKKFPKVGKQKTVVSVCIPVGDARPSIVVIKRSVQGYGLIFRPSKRYMRMLALFVE